MGGRGRRSGTTTARAGQCWTPLRQALQLAFSISSAGSLRTTLKKTTDKARDVSLDRIFGASHQEIRNPTWADTIDVQKVTLKNGERPSRMSINQQRAEAGGNILDALPVVANHVVEIIGILVLAPAIESKRFEDHKGPRAADPHVPGRPLSKDRPALELDPVPILKRERQPRCDNGSKVGFNVAKRAALIGIA